MASLPTPIQARAAHRPEMRSAKRLRGRQLAVARAACALLSLFSLGVLAASVPARFQQLLTIAAEHRAALAQLGLSSAFLAWYVVGLDLVVVATCCAIGGVLAWRRPDERMALFVALMLVVYGIYVVRPEDALVAMPAFLQLPAAGVRTLGQICILIFTYLFPNGRFVPRWTGGLALVWSTLSVAWLLFPALPLNVIHLGPQHRMALPTFLFFLAWLSTGLFAQIYRYVRVSSPEQRQQTKWVVLGASAALVGFVVFQLPASVLPALQQPGMPRLVYVVIGVPLLYSGALCIPVAVGIAILRYHLFDIDLLINRTLVYGSLTAVLALAYFLCVLCLQAVVTRLTGQTQQPLVIVLSTLVIAALFQPLRGRIQEAIDRRFYRRRYDAAKTLARFSAAMSSEVDLTHLSNRLVAVVEETMQPSHVSLWLRPVRRSGSGDGGGDPPPRRPAPLISRSHPASAVGQPDSA